MSEKMRGTVAMTAAMIIIGTISWFVVISGQSVLDVVFWRCVFGAVALFVICAGMGLLRRVLNLNTLGWAILGGVAIVTNQLMLFKSFSLSSISVSAVTHSTQPFILVGLGAIFFGERLTLNKFAWLAISFGGLVLITITKPGLDSTGPDYVVGTDYVGGIALAFGAAFLWAISTITTKKLKGTPPQLIALIHVCVGMLMLIPFTNLENLPDTASSWGALIALGVVHTGIVYVLMYGAVQKLPTHLLGSLSFIYPVTAVLVDLIAFGYRPQLGQIVGAVAILLATVGMNLDWHLIKPRPDR